MAVTTNLNSNTKCNGKITEVTLNNKLKSNTFLRGYCSGNKYTLEAIWNTTVDLSTPGVGLPYETDGDARRKF